MVDIPTDDEIESMSVEEIDNKIKEIESSVDVSDSDIKSAPSTETKDSLYKFFRDILNLKDSKKVGNLDNHELGKTILGVRHYYHIANYAHTEGLDVVADYLKDEAEIVVATSMSKHGFLAQLFVTQIKKEKKEKEPEKLKKRWFAKNIAGKGDDSNE